MISKVGIMVVSGIAGVGLGVWMNSAVGWFVMLGVIGAGAILASGMDENGQ